MKKTPQKPTPVKAPNLVVVPMVLNPKLPNQE